MTHIKLFDLKWESTSWLKAVETLTIDSKYLNISNRDIGENNVTDGAITDYLASQYNNQLEEWSWELIN